MIDYSNKQDKQFDIIHETSVDFVLRPCSREVNIVQYDNSLSFLKIKLYRDTKPFKIEDFSSITFQLNYGKPNRESVEITAEYYSQESDDCTALYFPITDAMSELNGLCKAVVKMTYNNKYAHSSQVLFKVLKNTVQN